MQIEKNITEGKKSNMTAFGLAGGTALQPLLENGYKYLGDIILSFDYVSKIGKSFVDLNMEYSFITLAVTAAIMFLGGRK